MNLKKIIKEEMDDFDWANDVTGINHLEWEKNSENFGGPANLARDLYNNDPMGFLNMLNNLNIVQSKENSDWTLFKSEKGDNMMVYDRKYKYVYISYYNIWLFLSEGFGLNHTEIRSLTKKWLGKTYNLRGITIKHTLFSCFLSLGESYNLKRYVNLKKIIKEEIGDFDWIKDIKADPFIGYFDAGYESVGFIVKTIEENMKAQEMLFELGYDWRINLVMTARFKNKTKSFKYLNEGHPSMLWVENDKIILHSSIDHIEEVLDTDIVIDNPFENDLNINESTDEWDWIEGPLNPWHEYDAIIFDIEPTREDVDMYIEMALESRCVNNASEWTEDIRNNDINRIIENGYLGFFNDYTSEDNLGYPIEPRYRTDNTILYSMLINKSLKESVKLPIEIGDTVYMGKFKNKKVVIKDISWNEKGDLMINGKSALRLRIPMANKPKKRIVKEEQDDLDWIRDTEGGVWILPRNRQWMIVLGNNYNEQQWNHIIRALDQHGWESIHHEKDYSPDITAISHDRGTNGYTYWRTPEEDLPIDDYVGYGKRLYDIKDLF